MKTIKLFAVVAVAVSCSFLGACKSKKAASDSYEDGAAIDPGEPVEYVK